MSRNIQWRWFEERDIEAADSMHRELEARIGRKMDRPNLLRRPVIGSVVGEVEGKVVQGFFGEAELEVCACSPFLVTPEEMREPVEMLANAAKGYDIRLVRCFVPSQMLVKTKRGRDAAMERLLTSREMGFTRENESLAGFFRWLDREAA